MLQVQLQDVPSSTDKLASRTTFTFSGDVTASSMLFLTDNILHPGETTLVKNFDVLTQ